MKALDQLLVALGDLGPGVTVSRHAGAVAFTSRTGAQVVAVQEPDGQVSVTYEEAPHIPRSQKSTPAAGARLLKRALERKHPQRIEPNE